VDPAWQVVAPGSTFTVTILQTSDVATLGVEASISFDPALVQVDSVQRGDAYAGANLLMGVAPQTPEEAIAAANESGSLENVAVAFVTPGSGSVPAGDEPALVITMRALSGVIGTSIITLTAPELADTNGDAIDNVTASPGGVHVGFEGDATDTITPTPSPTITSTPTETPTMTATPTATSAATNVVTLTLETDPAERHVMSGQPGATMTARAILHGALPGAGGTISYTVYRDDACRFPVRLGPPASYPVVDGVAPPSAPFTFGGDTNYWQARYSGDAENRPATSDCEDGAVYVDSLNVLDSLPNRTIGPNTSVQAAAQLHGLRGGGGGSVSYAIDADTSGGGATVTYGLNTLRDTAAHFPTFPPGATVVVGGVAGLVETNDETTITIMVGWYKTPDPRTQYVVRDCSRRVAEFGPFDLVDGAPPSSPTYTFVEPGRYEWRASYSGDGVNAGGVTPCGGDSLSVEAGFVNLVRIDASINDVTCLGLYEARCVIVAGDTAKEGVTLRGVTDGAGGTISYGLYRDPGCSQFIEDETPEHNTVDDGVAPASKPHVSNEGGLVYWRAEYSGDANNQTAANCVELLVLNRVTVQISPAKQTIDAGSTFTVHVVQDSTVGTKGAQTDFAFDQTRLQIVSVERGSAYPTDPEGEYLCRPFCGYMLSGELGQTLEEAIAEANTTGVLKNVAVAYLSGEPTVPPGQREFLTITLRALAGPTGDVDLDLGLVEVIDFQNFLMSVTSQDGSVRVVGDGDDATATATATAAATSTATVGTSPTSTATGCSGGCVVVATATNTRTSTPEAAASATVGAGEPGASAPTSTPGAISAVLGTSRAPSAPIRLPDTGGGGGRRGGGRELTTIAGVMLIVVLAPLARRRG
jgi:hypothetical protein